VSFRVDACGPEAAETVLRLTRLAFGPQTSLRPPSGALSETLETVRSDLELHGGAVAWREADGVGALRLVRLPDHLHVRRVAVDPAWQGRGAGRALMEWARREALAAGYRQLRLGVRSALPQNVAFYERLGYRVIAEHPHRDFPAATWLELALDL
jgi:tRNA threonylcarbamoyladenosine biosynthesis protein TsaE